MHLLFLSLLALSLALSACKEPKAAKPELTPAPTAVEVTKPAVDGAAAPQGPAASRTPSFEAPKEAAKMPLKYMWRWVSAKEQSSYQARRQEVSRVDVGTFRLGASTGDGLKLERFKDERSKVADWITIVASPAQSDGALIAYDKRTILIAAYARTSTGGELIAVSAEDGAVLWREPLKALGDVAHMAYDAQIQLYMDNDRVIVHGIESSGCYTEVRSPKDGALIDSERIDCELVKPPSKWPTPRHDEPEAVVWLNVDSRPVASLKALGKNLDVKGFELDYKDDSSWSVRLNADHATHGRLAADQDRIYVAKAHRIAAGAQVVAFDRLDGAQAWATATFGVGPIGHSRYSNVLQTLTVTSRGVELYAVESGCSYLEVLDPVSGRTLVNHRYYTY